MAMTMTLDAAFDLVGDPDRFEALTESETHALERFFRAQKRCFACACEGVDSPVYFSDQLDEWGSPVLECPQCETYTLFNSERMGDFEPAHDPIEWN